MGKAKIELYHVRTRAETFMKRVSWRVCSGDYYGRAKTRIERGTLRWLSMPTSSHQSLRTSRIAMLAFAAAIKRCRPVDQSSVRRSCAHDSCGLLLQAAVFHGLTRASVATVGEAYRRVGDEQALLPVDIGILNVPSRHFCQHYVQHVRPCV